MKISELCRENEKIHSLLTFNSQKESIVRIVKRDSEVFVVTYMQKLDCYGRISEFEYHGYILENKHLLSGSAFITMWCNIVYDKEYQYVKNIFINDFICKTEYQNKGYGSIVMEQLIQYAKQLKVEYILGELSFVDIGTSDTEKKHIKNRKRLYHFYPKFGFNIEEHLNKYGNTEKKIRLNINKSSM